MVAQAVEDQLGQLPSSGDDADVAAATGGDSVADAADSGVRGQPLHGLDRGPAHQPASLFGDPTAVHGGVGLVVFWGQPGPGGQLLGLAEAGDVADFGDEYPGQHRPDPGDDLDGLVAGVSTQAAGDQLGEQVDLEVQRGDQSQQGVDPDRDSTATLAEASSCWPAAPNRSLIGTVTPAPARIPWT